RWPQAHRSKLALPMPPMTASSRVSLSTTRCVSAKRFITLALWAPTAPVFFPLMAASLPKDFAAGEKRRQDKRDRRLRRYRLLDPAVEDERELALAGDGVILDRERVEHRPHGLADQGLAEVELTERAALRHE